VKKLNFHCFHQDSLISNGFLWLRKCTPSVPKRLTQLTVSRMSMHNFDDQYFLLYNSKYYKHEYKKTLKNVTYTRVWLKVGTKSCDRNFSKDQKVWKKKFRD
jgi:hypothetical protein